MKEKIATSSKTQPKPKKSTAVYTIDTPAPTPLCIPKTLTPLPPLNSSLLSAANASQPTELTPRKRQIAELYDMIAPIPLAIRRLTATVNALKDSAPVLFSFIYNRTNSSLWAMT